MNKRHYEHTLPNIRGSLSNTYKTSCFKFFISLDVFCCASCKLSLGVLVSLPVGGFQALDTVYLFLGKQDTPSYPLSFDVS